MHVVMGTCLSLVQRTHSVPAEVIFIVLVGNLSIQVTQVDICNAAIPEWKLLILVKKRLGARYVRPVTIPVMLTPCFRLLWSFQRKMLLLVDPTLTEAGLCLLWSFRRDPLLLIDLSLALR